MYTYMHYIVNSTAKLDNINSDLITRYCCQVPRSFMFIQNIGYTVRTITTTYNNA